MGNSTSEFSFKYNANKKYTPYERQFGDFLNIPNNDTPTKQTYQWMNIFVKKERMHCAVSMCSRCNRGSYWNETDWSTVLS